MVVHLDDHTMLGIIALIMGISGVIILEFKAIDKGINGNLLRVAIAAIGVMAGLGFGVGVGG